MMTSTTQATYDSEFKTPQWIQASRIPDVAWDLGYFSEAGVIRVLPHWSSASRIRSSSS